MRNIIKATKGDKNRAVNILSASFKNDPQINWMIGKEPNREPRFKRLMSYAFEQGMANGQIYLTEDRDAVAIWRNHKSNNFSWGLMIESIKFLFAFGIKRLKNIKEMELMISKNYPTDKPFEYLWFIGTTPEKQGKGYGSLLLNSVLAKAKQEGNEIYLETSTENNVSYYKNKGFKTYNHLELKGSTHVIIHLLKTS